jgi:hypothetical protein
MELKVIRKIFTNKSTIGELHINGKFFCYTLEDKDRYVEQGGKKEFGITAIPRGTYSVVLSFSNRFQKYLPEILNVPQFVGIRMHTGNYTGKGALYKKCSNVNIDIPDTFEII